MERMHDQRSISTKCVEESEAEGALQAGTDTTRRTICAVGFSWQQLVLRCPSRLVTKPAKEDAARLPPSCSWAPSLRLLSPQVLCTGYRLLVEDRVWFSFVRVGRASELTPPHVYSCGRSLSDPPAVIRRLFAAVLRSLCAVGGV
jgi:hypothetical protein